MVGSYDSKDESENKKLILAKFNLILKTFKKDNVGAFSPGSIVLKRPTEVVMWISKGKNPKNLKDCQKQQKPERSANHAAVSWKFA